MSIALKAANIKYKNSDGEYVNINTISDNVTAEQILSITTKGAEVLASIPSDYTSLSTLASNNKSRLDNIINDSAGDGVTTQVWSAGKIWNEIAVGLMAGDKLTEIMSGANLDNYKTTGCYWVAYGHQSDITNLPTNQACRVMVMDTTGRTGRVQIVLTENLKPELYMRFYNGTIWRSWTYLSDTDLQLSGKEMTEVTSGDDLDTYVNPGNFWGASGHQSDIDNLPTNNAFRLTVMNTTGRTGVMQIILTENLTPQIYLRFYNGSVWRPWVKLTNANDDCLYIKRLTFDDDLDNLKTSGTYDLMGGNEPENTPYTGTNAGVFVIAPSAAHVIQYFFPRTSDGRIYRRTYNSLAGWSGWERIDTVNVDLDQTYVKKSQGLQNVGKILMVGNDGNITTGEEVPEPIVNQEYVKYTAAVTLYLGSDIVLGSSFELNDSWTGDLSSGFTHVANKTGNLVIKIAPEESGKYMVTITTNSYSPSDRLNVKLGDATFIDTYNGSTSASIGFVSDGGYLYINANANPASIVKITNIKVRKIQDSGTAMTIYPHNVNQGQTVSDITGFWNVAIGDDTTMDNNVNGSRNIGIGKMALHRFKSGTRNVCIGTFAMPYVTSGERNIAIGADTIYNESYNNVDSEAYNNIAVGMGTLANGTVIQDNIAIGMNAMHHNSPTSSGNVTMGSLAADKVNNGNTSVGFRTNRFTEGDYNIAVGYRAGDTYAHGDNNIMIGYFARANANISDSIVIGNNLTATADNTVQIGEITQSLVLCGKKINFNLDGTVTWEVIN